MEVENVNPLWTVRERVFIDKMEQYPRKSEIFKVEVTKLGYQLLGPNGADICIRALAEGARDERGVKKKVLIDTEGGGGRGAEVADAIHKTNGADHLWMTEDRKELRHQEETGATYSELIP